MRRGFDLCSAALNVECLVFLGRRVGEWVVGAAMVKCLLVGTGRLAGDTTCGVGVCAGEGLCCEGVGVRAGEGLCCEGVGMCAGEGLCCEGVGVCAGEGLCCVM